MSRSYSREEVEEILRRAAQRAGAEGEPLLSRQELVDAAREAGIDPEAVHRAAEEVETGVAPVERLPTVEQAVVAWDARRRRRFTTHVLTWLVVCAGLLVLNLLAGGAFWFQWPLAGWGILVALQAIATFRAASPEQIERVKQKHRRKLEAERKKLEAARRSEEKRRAKAEREQGRDRRQAKVSAFESAFEAAVEEGVAALMDAATRTLTEVARRSRPPPRVETDFDRYVAQRKGASTGSAARERVPLRVDPATQESPQRVRFEPAEEENEPQRENASARRQHR